MKTPIVPTAIAALLAFAPAVSTAGLYTSKSPVLQVDYKNFDKLITKSNHTSVRTFRCNSTNFSAHSRLANPPHHFSIQIVEFYAPWCGHCQNLKPAYEKVANSLDGLAIVAAVNCDEDTNKQLCGSFGVQGFPTLKIFRPGNKGKAIPEDYQGERSAKAIYDAVTGKIKNHVKRVEDKNIDEFLSTNNASAKALLFTDKGTTSALLRSVAIDFLDSITVGQVRDKQTKVVEMFGIEKFPTLVLLPGGDKDGIVFDGTLKKDPIVEFLSQAATPNPNHGLNARKKTTSAKKPETAEKTPPSSEDEPKIATEDTQKPIVVEEIAPLPSISKDLLFSDCLTKGACLFAFVPKSEDSRERTAKDALDSLARLAHKYTQNKRKLFPVFAAHPEDEYSQSIVQELGLSGDKTYVVVLNARRGWWRLYEGDDFSFESLESWVDQVRMGEGVKKQLPETFEKILSQAAEPVEQTASSETATEAADESTATNEDETSAAQDTEEAKPTDEAHAKDEL